MNTNFPTNLPKSYGPFGGPNQNAKHYVLSAIMNETEKQVAKAADEHIEQKVANFKRELLAKKPEIITAIMNSIRIATDDSLIDPYQLNIRIEYKVDAKNG